MKQTNEIGPHGNIYLETLAARLLSDVLSVENYPLEIINERIVQTGQLFRLSDEVDSIVSRKKQNMVLDYITLGLPLLIILAIRQCCYARLRHG